MRRALICVTLLIALCSNRGVYRMALTSRKGVLVSTIPIPMCHLWSADGYQFSISYFCYTAHVLFMHCLQVVRQNCGTFLKYNRHKEESEFQHCKFVHSRMLCRRTQLLWLISSCLIKKMSISFWIDDDTFILWVLIL